jgi:CheY-like chemotaxis protein
MEDPVKFAVKPCVGTETLLVVDDEQAIRVLIRRMLERNGYTVLVAATADEALELFETNPSISAVLTDAIMPVSNGTELMTRLMKQRPDVRVIFMSGYTAEYIVELGCVNPAMAFLSKPFTGETLSRTIREVLDR